MFSTDVVRVLGSHRTVELSVERHTTGSGSFLRRFGLQVGLLDLQGFLWGGFMRVGQHFRRRRGFLFNRQHGWRSVAPEAFAVLAVLADLVGLVGLAGLAGLARHRRERSKMEYSWFFLVLYLPRLYWLRFNFNRPPRSPTLLVLDEGGGQLVSLFGSKSQKRALAQRIVQKRLRDLMNGPDNAFVLGAAQ